MEKKIKLRNKLQINKEKKNNIYHQINNKNECV